MSSSYRTVFYLMSTTVIPAGADGAWIMESLTTEEAFDLVTEADLNANIVSAVGHESTAEAMSKALDYPVIMNRITVVPVPGDRFLCFRLNSRPPEGAILNLQTLQEVGFSFCLMTFFGPYSDIV